LLGDAGCFGRKQAEDFSQVVAHGLDDAIRAHLGADVAAQLDKRAQLGLGKLVKGLHSVPPRAIYLQILLIDTCMQLFIKKTLCSESNNNVNNATTS
jgi:hypothetical protein